MIYIYCLNKWVKGVSNNYKCYWFTNHSKNSNIRKIKAIQLIKLNTNV